MTTRSLAGRQFAARTDDLLGIREEHEFFGPCGNQMLACLHLPRAGARAGAVICSSVRSEFETNYRREILLGRALAARGIASMRFQYLGTGNSDGSEGELSIETMEADASQAVAHLVARYAPGRLVFVGTRLGAIVAARVASNHLGAPLALWEPALDPALEFRQIFRSRRFWAAKEEDEEEGPAESALDELGRRGFVDVLGHPIHRRLYESAVGSRVGAELARGPRPILLVQLGTRRELRPQYRALAEKWREAGTDVTCRAVEEKESWWLEPPGEAQGKRTLISSPAVEATAEWVGDVLPEGDTR